MLHLTRLFAVVLAALAGLSLASAQAQTPEPRIALVIGNSAYKAGSLATPANDAGLVAQTLTQAGFDVIGARDLDQEGLRRSFRDFLDKAAAAGPQAVAFVYLAGYGLQYAGENYFVPVEASIPRDSSVPIEALRMSDFSRALADIPLKARILVLDAARANPFAPTGQPLAGGLALVEPESGSLVAFNAAPGTIPPAATGDYGPYARALAEMMQDGGLDLPEVFARTRLRVSEQTRGAQTPWDESRLTQPVVLFERPADAPAPRAEAPRSRVLRDLPVADAYALALERDTIAAYQEFLTAYPADPLSPRVEAMLAARREALTWRRAVERNTPAAYWSYIKRYPGGPHVADAHRRLAILSAAFDPPPVFEEYEFDVPPPPEREYVFVSRPVLIFDDTYYPPPPPPIYFLPPPPREYVELPPPRFVSPGFLPVPVPVFLPTARPWRDDVYRQPPPARLPQNVTPRDPGAPPRFIAPTQTSAPPNATPRPAALPGMQQQAPIVSPQRAPSGGSAPLLSPQRVAPALPQDQTRRLQGQTLPPSRQIDPRRLEQMRAQPPQGQPLSRQPQTGARQAVQPSQQPFRQPPQRAQQPERQQPLRQERAQQFMQQQQMRQQQQQQMQQQQAQRQREQQQQQMRQQQQQMQMRQQQQQQQQQMQRQREQQQQQMQMRQQQQQQMQQQMQRQREQQQQQQMRQQQQQQQMQQQMQHQREQQQRAQQQQQQQQQQRQQHQRNDCGAPGKPPCR